MGTGARWLRNKLILLLIDKETVYVGPGVYHWINFEGKLLLRNTQTIIGTGKANVVTTEQYKGIVYTANRERAWDELNAEWTRKEAERQALAYYEWLQGAR